jgi:hypothetical protein
MSAAKAARKPPLTWDISSLSTVTKPTIGKVCGGNVLHQPDRSDKNSWPHPVIASGRLYVRDQDILLCYDVQAK